MKYGRWSTIRAAVQIILWLLFIGIIIATRYPVKDSALFTIIPRLSPYLAITLSLSTQSILSIFFPSLVVLALTALLGRFFCGWICPLGSTLDATDKQFAFRGGISKKKSIKPYKYFILVISIILSIAGIQVLSIIDPLSIAVRSYSAAIYPYLDNVLKLLFDGLYRLPLINTITEPLYALSKDYLLDFNIIQFYNHLPIFLLFLGILVISWFARRFWCRAICPLGAIFALTSRFALTGRLVDTEKCINCLKCEKNCKMNAIHNKGNSTDESECIRCFDCLKSCKQNATSFTFTFPFQRKNQKSLKKYHDYNNFGFTRRRLIRSLIISIFAIPIFRQKPGYTKDHSKLIRPPGALPEEDFIDRCIRCGECMKVCPTNGLHPLFLEYGLERIFTPVLIPRIGSCEKNCNLCSRICPSGALKEVAIPDKETTIIGTAYIIRDLCIPWSEYKDCLVCEEMCPTKKKAIIFKEEIVINKAGKKARVKFPYVLEDICFGCGICENKCPVSGDSAIQVRTPKRNYTDIIAEKTYK